MKTIYIIAILALFSCSEEAIEPSYVKDIHPDVEKHVNTFFSEAESRGIDIDDRIIIDFADLGEPSPHNYRYAEASREGQKRITFNIHLFYDKDDQRREALVFFYLGRLNYKPMKVNTYSLMNPQLFIYGYDQNDRETLINDYFGQ